MTSRPSVADLIALLDAEARATPGPWGTDRHPNPDCSVRYVVPKGLSHTYEVFSGYMSLEENLANTKFVASLRNAARPIVIELLRVRAGEGCYCHECLPVEGFVPDTTPCEPCTASGWLSEHGEDEK